MRKIYLVLGFFSGLECLQAQWNSQTSNTTQALHGVHVSVDGSTAWAVGGAATIRKTTNAGATWANVPNPGIFDHFDVKFRPDNQTGWVATGQGVMRTTNGGTTWTDISFAPAAYVFGIDFLNDNDGLAAATVLGIFKTQDGGQSWNQIITAPDMLFSKVEFGSDVDTAWALGWDVNTNVGKIYKLTNVGGIWDASLQYTGPASSEFHGLAVINNSTAFAAGNTGLLKTTNGTDWSPVTLPSPAGSITSVSALDASRIIAGRGDGSVVYTNDGTNWNLHTGNNNTNTLYDIQAVNADIAYAVGTNGTILNTSNLLLPIILSSFTAQSQNHKVLLNWSTTSELNNTGFAIMRKPTTGNSQWEQIGFVRSFGNSNTTQSYAYTDEPKGGNEFLYQLKQIDFDGKFTLSNILKVKLEISGVTLSSYPNPFRSQTTINYSNPTKSDVQLFIRNQFGQIVKTVVNAKQQHPGNYAVTVNTNELAAGAYYAELYTGKARTSTKLNLVR